MTLPRSLHRRLESPLETLR